jgi:hypothetical protein
MVHPNPSSSCHLLHYFHFLDARDVGVFDFEVVDDASPPQN